MATDLGANRNLSLRGEPRHRSPTWLGFVTANNPAPLDHPGREGGRGYGGFISKLAGGGGAEAASNHKIFQKTPF